MSALIAVLEDEDPDVRGAAAAALGMIGDRRGVEALIAALDDEEWPVRSAAAHALGTIGDEAAIGALSALLSDEEEGVRGAAASSLEDITGVHLGEDAGAWREWREGKRADLGSES